MGDNISTLHKVEILLGKVADRQGTRRRPELVPIIVEPAVDR